MSRLVGQPARDLSLEEPALMLRTAMLRKAWLLGAVGAARGPHSLPTASQGGIIQRGQQPVTFRGQASNILCGVAGLR